MPRTRITPQEAIRWNSDAWDRLVAGGNMWTRPVSDDTIARAREGNWEVVLIGLQPVNRGWFPETLAGIDLLGLASGGGQQGPILAAAGANVTIFDNSKAQLAQDADVAERHNLGIRTVKGNMADLSAFEDASFDLVFHPVSNVFAPEILPVWREAFRVLRPGGRLLAGFMNPDNFIFDYEHFDKTGERFVRFSLPYSDEEQRTLEELAAFRAEGAPLEYGHTLSDQIGGQLAAGFVLRALEEGGRTEAEGKGPIDGHAPVYIATFAEKPLS